ncbi:efflux RND transporter permease subunit, partial [Klebsiella variicola]|uniref:efflux RND transporter permease subunit n=2 Tax=Pseudomonadota TaxID=1224 RepID=UPI00273130D2
GSLVRLKDVARIELGSLLYNSSTYANEKPTVVIATFQMPGSNALELKKNIEAKMKELSARFPKGIEYTIFYDTTKFVSAAMEDVVKTLLEA